MDTEGFPMLALLQTMLEETFLPVQTLALL